MCSGPGRKLRCAGHGDGGPLVEPSESRTTDGGTGQLRVLGARRSASGEGGEDVDYEPTRLLPGRNRRNPDPRPSSGIQRLHLLEALLQILPPLPLRLLPP